jgi:hypothetical protein
MLKNSLETSMKVMHLRVVFPLPVSPITTKVSFFLTRATNLLSTASEEHSVNKSIAYITNL